MSTRSLIAIKNADDSVSAIYCHFDGYPSGVGATLLKHYSDDAKVKALLALGSISSLGERIAPEPDEGHDFEHQVDGVTVAYHRDRGEKLLPPCRYDSADQMLEKAPDDSWAELCYVWDGKDWYFDEAGEYSSGWRLVSDELKED